MEPSNNNNPEDNNGNLVEPYDVEIHDIEVFDIPVPPPDPPPATDPRVSPGYRCPLECHPHAA